MGQADGVVKDAVDQADGGDVGPETVVSATEAPEIFSEMIDRAIAGERIRITRYGRTKVYIVGEKDYERFRELERAAKAGQE